MGFDYYFSKFCPFLEWFYWFKKLKSYWTHNHQFLATFFAYKSVWQLQKSSFPINVKICVDSPEDESRRSISVGLPNSWPITRYNETRFLYNKQVVMRTRDITAMPRSNFSSFDLNFYPRLWTARSKVFNVGPVVFSLFFFTSFSRFRIFPDR